MKSMLTAMMLMGSAVMGMAATKALFLTGGQSNTDGRLYAETLPAYLQTANNYCMASNQWPYEEARLGVFYPYYPTSGTTGQYSRWAYDAVTYYYIGQALQETFYVAKTSYGGTSIDPSVSNSGSQVNSAPFLSQYGSGYHWSADPTFLAATAIAGTNFESNSTTYTGQSMLLAWIANIDAAIDAIKAQGDTPDIKAIIWHQGESDKNVAGGYYNNLKAMVAYLRNHLVEKTGDSKYATLPFFCGTIPHASSLVNSTVEKAFYTLEEEDANFHVIDLRDLTMLSDTKHFDAPSAELFGKRLYNRMVDEGVISGDKLDVAYAEIDYSDFGTDQFVGATKTWTFESFTSDLITSTTCFDNLYLHSANSNSRRFISGTTSVGSVTFADGTTQAVSRTLTTATGAYGWTIDNISKEGNASNNKKVSVAANILYPGRFSMMVSAPKATADAPTTIQLIFNGKIVVEKVFTSNSEVYELYYDAATAGTYYMHPDNQCQMYAVRYVPTTDRTSQRTVTTDADGYATFGNLTGANLGLPEGLKAWAVAPSTESSQMVEITKLSGVDKGTGALLQGEPETEYVLPFAWTAQNYEGENDMTAQQTTNFIEETSGEDFINYTFANQQFTKVSGTVNVEAGKAYLSISNGAAQCAYSTLTIAVPDEDLPIAYDFVDVYILFENDEAVTQKTTWRTGDMTTPGSDGTVQQLNGLYGRGQSGSKNRSFFKASGTGSASFSDGTKVSWSSYLYINNDYSGSWSLSASTHANNTNCGDYLAANIAVPGTFYVLFSSKDASSERTLDLYYEGVKAASATSTGSDDIKEIKYSVAAAGTLVLDCRKTCRVYALRFVPTDKVGVYNRVTDIGWGSMSLPYPAIVPDGTSAYYVSNYEDGDPTGTLTLKKVNAGEVIPAQAGFLFNGVKGLYRLEKSMTAASWTDNMLKGTAEEALTGYNSASATDPIYVLAKIDDSTVGFKKFSGTSIDQYKAYLQLGTIVNASTFRFDIDGETTGVTPLLFPEGEDVVRVSWYTLDGRKLERKPTVKGVYIVNGKKTVIK